MGIPRSGWGQDSTQQGSALTRGGAEGCLKPGQGRSPQSGRDLTSGSGWLLQGPFRRAQQDPLRAHHACQDWSLRPTDVLKGLWAAL